MLAAGASSRLGVPKQLVIREGVPLVRRAAVAAVDAGASPVMVVLGANASTVAPALSGLAAVSTLVNSAWQSGLSSSLTVGLSALFADDECEGALVVLADQPFVDAGSLSRLITEFAGVRDLVASSYGGTIGVPAIFGRAYVADLVRLTGDAGAGDWLRQRSRDVKRVALERAAIDVDTPFDAGRIAGGGDAIPASRA